MAKQRAAVAGRELVRLRSFEDGNAEPRESLAESQQRVWIVFRDLTHVIAVLNAHVGAATPAIRTLELQHLTPRYPGLAEFWYLAEHVTGITAATLIKASRVDLADSARHAPQAGSGDTDFYPDLYDKAAVLACRIAWNHPLPDGNKRAVWACLVLFIDLNDGTWNDEAPDTDDAVDAMLTVAAREVDETWLANWLRQRVTFRT